MPPSPTTPDQLRRRASTLRTVASKIECTHALDLHRRAGDDVWRGPTPRHCLDDLLQIRFELLAAAEDLRDGARTLDMRAAQLDGQALIHSPDAS